MDTRNTNLLVIGLGAGLGVLTLVVASFVFYFLCHRRSPRQKLHIDLENDFPPMMKSTPILPNSLHPTTPDGSTNSPDTSPWVSHTIQPPPKEFDGPSLFGSPSLTAPSPARTIEMGLRRITLGRPPPAYTDCVSSHHASFWPPPRLEESMTHDSGLSSLKNVQ